MRNAVLLVIVGVVTLIGVAGFAAASSLGHNGSAAQATGMNGSQHYSGGGMMGGHGMMGGYGMGCGNMAGWNYQYSNSAFNGSAFCPCT